MWYGTHKRGMRVHVVPSPSHMYIPPLVFPIEHWFILVLICLVLDLEDATSWYTITMSWPNVPCTELPP